MKNHIYIYSPSSAVRNKAHFKKGVQRLKKLGYDVEVDEAALSKYQRFAGDDAVRIAAIDRAASSGASVALISRGGYGLTRLLPAIGYKGVAKAIDKGTRFVGLSDFTAFQMAVLAKTGRSTWAGPAMATDFGDSDTPDDIMEACFDDLMTGSGEGAGWQLPKPAAKPVAGDAAGALAGALASGRRVNAPEGALEVKNAVLWGGNLSVIAALVGTPYMPPIKGGILFLEDDGEHPYRVERMLTQLLLAGVLAQQKAIVLGQFTRFKPALGYDSGFGMASVAARLQGQVKAQVLTGLPFGHVPTKVCLPFGVKTSLIVEGRDAFLLWGHAH